MSTPLIFTQCFLRFIVLNYERLDVLMSYRYSVIQTDQRPVATAPSLVLFAAPAAEIAQWASVERLGLGGEGVQRRRNESKVRAVARFLEKDDRNTLPTAITVALWDTEITAEGECAFITVPKLEAGGRGLIIDGQHRLYGAQEFDPHFQLNIVGILEPSQLEIAFQFLVINNKASKVPTDHIRLLSIGVNDEDLTERLASARMSINKRTPLVAIADLDDASPFYHSVTWPVPHHEPDRQDLVRPAAIETALGAVAQRELIGLDTDDALLGFFFAVWGAIKDEWSALWRPGSHLLSKAGLVAMTQFLLDDVTPLVDRDRLNAANPDEVASEIKDILADLSPDFWESEWTMTGLDTAAGRQVIVESLQRVRRNRRRDEPWFTGIKLVASGQASSAANDVDG